MTAMSERTPRFGFAQFRFVVAAILLLAAGLKAHQLATVPLPPVVQGSVFTSLLELLNDRFFRPLEIENSHVTITDNRINASTQCHPLPKI